LTLVELLIALALLALMAALSWRGLNGIERAQHQLAQQDAELSLLQTALAQWQTDLDALAAQPNSPSLDWDGRVLRILRQSADAGAGLHVVAWGRRVQDSKGLWLRWDSGPLTQRQALQQAWQEAQQWGENPSPAQRQREVALCALDQWQIYYFYDNAWSHPLSSAGKAEISHRLPNAIRLVLQLSPGQAIQGSISLDWARFGGAR
jgi:general secretion pathway protein J